MVEISEPLLYKPANLTQRSSSFFTGPLIAMLLVLLVPASMFAVYGIIRTTYKTSHAMMSPIPPIHAAESPSSTPVPPPEPTPDSSAFQKEKNAKLAEVLTPVLASYTDIDTSLTFVDIRTGTAVSVNGKTHVTAASTTKLITAIYFLQEVERGTYTLEDSLGTYDAQSQLEQLINRSNNDSWERFNTLLTYKKLEDFAKSIGMSTFHSDDNSISPADMARLLFLLYRNRLLSVEHTKMLLSYMQHTDEETLIPPALPVGWRIYHKYGKLDEYLHDAAIIENGRSPFILVVYTKADDVGKYDRQTKLIQEITRTIVAHMPS